MKKFFLILLAIVGISFAANAQVDNQNDNQNQKTEKKGKVCTTTTDRYGSDVYGNGVYGTTTTKTCGDTKTVTTNTCTTAGFKGGVGPVKVEGTREKCTEETKNYKKVKTEGGTRERWVETE